MAVVICAVLAIVIVSLALVIVKSMSQPKKVEGIEKLIKQGKYPAAIKAAKQMTAKEPENFLAHYYLGRAYLESGRAELSLVEYKIVNDSAVFGEGLEELPFRKEVSQLYLKFNQQKDALREFLLLTKLEPKNPENFYNAGKLYEAQGREDLALGFFKKTALLDKKHAKAYASIGLILYHLRQFPEAKKSIDYALSISPDTWSTYYYLGKILKDSKDFGGALKAFEKAQRDQEYRQKALIEHGSCYMLAGRPDNGIADFTRAIEMDRQNARQETLYARYFLASCCEQSHKIDKAIEQWTAIAKKNRGFKDVAAKLEEYKDLQSNDALKDYLTSPNEEFMEICKGAAEAASLSAQSCSPAKWGCVIIAVEKKTDDWRNMRKQLFYLAFYRNAEPVEDAVARDALDKMKGAGCMKAYIFSSADFSPSASAFAESRPIELVGKEKLEQLLQKAGAK